MFGTMDGGGIIVIGIFYCGHRRTRPSVAGYGIESGSKGNRYCERDNIGHWRVQER